jgi:small conductance mechanosensitive channel
MPFDYQPYLTKGQELLFDYGIKVVTALIIFFIGRWVAGVMSRIIGKAIRKSKADETLARFVVSLSYIAFLAFVIIASLNQLGIQTASFIAILGAAGLAVGLALQGSLANFAAGVLMLIFRHFKVGDYIEGGGTAGSVLEINIFTTLLTSPDNRKIICPNSKMMSDNIVNFSAQATRRVDLVVGVSYQDDLDKVQAVLREVLAADVGVLKDPAPTVEVVEMADSSVNFVVRPWVATEDYWAIRFRLNKTIKQRFDTEGISIPFPQRDVHLIQTGN